MPRFKKYLTLVVKLILEALYNTRVWTSLRPLRITLGAMPEGDPLRSVEALTALFYRSYKSKQIVDFHDAIRLDAYCRTLGISLSKPSYASPYRIHYSPDYKDVLRELTQRIHERIRDDERQEYLRAFMQFVDYAYGERKLLDTESNFSIVPAGHAISRAQGRIYTFSVFNCAVVIADCSDRVVVSHMKIGHPYTRRAEASVQEFMREVCAKAHKDPIRVRIIADNSHSVSHMISESFRVNNIDGEIYIHQKDQNHCASIMVDIKDGRITVRSSLQIAEVVRWRGWSEITGIMPPSPLSVEVCFSQFGVAP